MEFHQAVAICIVIAMAFVIDSTVKLYKYRRKNDIQNLKGPLRDLSILRRPLDYPHEEARLTIRNWLSCAVMLGLMVLFLLTSPETLRHPGATAPQPPAASGAPGTAG